MKQQGVVSTVEVTVTQGSYLGRSCTGILASIDLGSGDLYCVCMHAKT